MVFGFYRTSKDIFYLDLLKNSPDMDISKKTKKGASPANNKKKAAKAQGKKTSPVKVAGKKTVSKRAAPKKSSSKTGTTRSKKTVPKQSTTKKVTPRKLMSRRGPVVKKSQPFPLEQPVGAGHEQMTMMKQEDPIRAVDQKTFDILTAKADPHKRLRLSSKPKGGIKPSGKKPLWN
jgi:hypothetical protein